MTSPHRKPGSELKNDFRLYRKLNRCRGWQAAFSLGGTKYARYFSDAAYGSPEAARQVAERFASENRDLHEELLPLRRRFEVRKTSRSGIPGVSRYEGDRKHGPYWLAYWDDQEGRRVSRRFSIHRHGEAEALKLAMEARQKGVRPFQERYEEVLAALGLLPDARGGSPNGRSDGG